jgi:integrase
VRQEILSLNPCHGVDRNPTNDRERVLSDGEVTVLWPRLEPALRLILLTAQRPGEVAAMQRDHIVNGFWQMPGKPVGGWPGTKNSKDHRVALSEPALELVEVHLATRSSAQMSSLRLKKLVKELRLEKVTPHDLRRTCLTWITRLEFGRDAMDRIANPPQGRRHRRLRQAPLRERGPADHGSDRQARRRSGRRGWRREQRGGFEVTAGSTTRNIVRSNVCPAASVC